MARRGATEARSSRGRHGSRIVSCLAWLADINLRGPKILIAGAPCSGKTTFADAHKLEDDEVLDWDVIHAELTGLPLYVQDESQIQRTVHEFGTRALSMRQGWIIATAPTIAQRRAIRERHHARSIVIEVWPGELLARLELADRPDVAKARLRPAIEQWWERYRPDFEARTWSWLGIAHETALNEYDLRSVHIPALPPPPARHRTSAVREPGPDGWLDKIAPSTSAWTRREW
jgi:hypothetical protein